MGFWDKLLGIRPAPPESARKLGRNAECWCGSGRKYKQCCRDSDQRYFSRELESACKSSG